MRIAKGGGDTLRLDAQGEERQVIQIWSEGFLLTTIEVQVKQTEGGRFPSYAFVSINGMDAPAAYRAGQERMRERAAEEVENSLRLWFGDPELRVEQAAHLRTLPLEEPE